MVQISKHLLKICLPMVALLRMLPEPIGGMPLQNHFGDTLIKYDIPLSTTYSPQTAIHNGDAGVYPVTTHSTDIPSTTFSLATASDVMRDENQLARSTPRTPTSKLERAIGQTDGEKSASVNKTFLYDQVMTFPMFLDAVTYIGQVDALLEQYYDNKLSYSELESKLPELDENIRSQLVLYKNFKHRNDISKAKYKEPYEAESFMEGREENIDVDWNDTTHLIKNDPVFDLWEHLHFDFTVQTKRLGAVVSKLKMHDNKYYKILKYRGLRQGRFPREEILSLRLVTKKLEHYVYKMRYYFKSSYNNRNQQNDISVKNKRAVAFNQIKLGYLVTEAMGHIISEHIKDTNTIIKTELLYLTDIEAVYEDRTTLSNTPDLTSNPVGMEMKIENLYYMGICLTILIIIIYLFRKNISEVLTGLFSKRREKGVHDTPSPFNY